MRKATFNKIKLSFLIIFILTLGVLLSSGNEPSPVFGQEDVPDIPDSFFEKERSKIWIEVKYDPEETELYSGDRYNYLEEAVMHLKAWQAHIDEAGNKQIIPADYRDWVYVLDISAPAVYDGKNGATNLRETGKGKRYIDWNRGEMTISLISIHWRYLNQQWAYLRMASDDDKTNLYQKPIMMSIRQWVDYRAIVKRDGSYWLVRKKPLYSGYPEDKVVKPGDSIICDKGADWFKASVVDVLNEDIDTFGKVNSIKISYGRDVSSTGAMTVQARAYGNSRMIIFYIAQPMLIAKNIRLNLGVLSGFNYSHKFWRTGVIRHEATHIYHSWCEDNRDKCRIEDKDNDGLVVHQDTDKLWELEGKWRWQIDDTFYNGFLGDLLVRGVDYPAQERPLAVNKSITITPSEDNNWVYFRKLISDNLPELNDPKVERGDIVPNGRFEGFAYLTFYWPKTSASFKLLWFKMPTADSGMGDRVNEFAQAVTRLEIRLGIRTPHHPQEYDCERVAGGIYKPPFERF